MHAFQTHRSETGPPTARPEPPRPSMLVFDRQAARAVDRAAIEEFGIPGVVLMENAARGACDQVMRLLADADSNSSADSERSVLIVCGPGNNGGDGYAIARHLINHGVGVTLAWTQEPKPGTDARTNFDICAKMQMSRIDLDRLGDPAETARFNLVVDALFGTGLDRPVDGIAAKAIERINASKRPVLAVDLPSGMDCDTGRPLGAAIKATSTVTFVGWKAGFLSLEAQSLLGEVVVADIGAPRELVERLGRRVEAHRLEPPERSMALEAPPRR